MKDLKELREVRDLMKEIRDLYKDIKDIDKDSLKAKIKKGEENEWGTFQ